MAVRDETIKAFKRVLEEVEQTERSNTRNAGTDYLARVFFRDHGRTLLDIAETVCFEARMAVSGERLAALRKLMKRARTLVSIPMEHRHNIDLCILTIADVLDDAERELATTQEASAGQINPYIDAERAAVAWNRRTPARPMAGRGQVKPLFWQTNQMYADGNWQYAETPQGNVYEVYQHRSTRFRVQLRGGTGGSRPTFPDFATIGEAQVAAQADYEARIFSTLTQPPTDEVTEATHRHNRSGTEYVLIGIGKMQSEEWHDPSRANFTDSPGPSVDMREVAIYRSATNPTEIWVRPCEEFEDGRFEVLAAPQAKSQPEGGE